MATIDAGRAAVGVGCPAAGPVPPGPGESSFPSPLLVRAFGLYALKDWCRFGGASTAYIDPGAPWQNPWVESYGSRMRDELLAINTIDSLIEAQGLVADWRNEYNTYRPHSALAMRTPHEYARRWRTNNQPQLS